MVQKPGFASRVGIVVALVAAAALTTSCKGDSVNTRESAKQVVAKQMSKQDPFVEEMLKEPIVQKWRRIAKRMREDAEALNARKENDGYTGHAALTELFDTSFKGARKSEEILKAMYEHQDAAALETAAQVASAEAGGRDAVRFVGVAHEAFNYLRMLEKGKTALECSSVNGAKKSP